MAYGNSTAGYVVEEAFVPYRLKVATKLAYAAATAIYKGNIVVRAADQTEGVQNAADTATFILFGVAADNMSTTHAAGDIIEVYPPGSVLWLKTLDTASLVAIGLPCYVDYGATGTPQHVTIGTAGATGATNQLGMVGVVRGFKTGYYLVDTSNMGQGQAAANPSFEIT